MDPRPGPLSPLYVKGNCDKFRTEFEEALAKAEQMYRHAISMSSPRGENALWPLVAQRVIQELHDWLFRRAGAHGLDWDPEHVEILRQSFDFGYQTGIGISGNFQPLPPDKVTREAYELFLCELVDEARERVANVEAARQLAEEKLRGFSRKLRWFGWRWCASCSEPAWIMHRHVPSEDSE